MLYLLILGILVFLALWTLAWRNRPVLAFGIFLGTATVWVIAAVLGPARPEHVPAWLPPLPFIVVAIALFYFGTLAWLWGRRR